MVWEVDKWFCRQHYMVYVRIGSLSFIPYQINTYDVVSYITTLRSSIMGNALKEGRGNERRGEERRGEERAEREREENMALCSHYALQQKGNKLPNGTNRNALPAHHVHHVCPGWRQIEHRGK